MIKHLIILTIFLTNANAKDFEHSLSSDLWLLIGAYAGPDYYHLKECLPETKATLEQQETKNRREMQTSIIKNDLKTFKQLFQQSPFAAIPLNPKRHDLKQVIDRHFATNHASSAGVFSTHFLYRFGSVLDTHIHWEETKYDREHIQTLVMQAFFGSERAQQYLLNQLQKSDLKENHALIFDSLPITLRQNTHFELESFFDQHFKIPTAEPYVEVMRENIIALSSQTAPMEALTDAIRYAKLGSAIAIDHIRTLSHRLQIPLKEKRILAQKLLFIENNPHAFSFYHELAPEKTASMIHYWAEQNIPMALYLQAALFHYQPEWSTWIKLPLFYKTLQNKNRQKLLDLIDLGVTI